MDNNFLMSIAFSVFGMLLIFGLGFIFPAANPYIVIKWIVIACAAVFVYSFLGYFIKSFLAMKKTRKAGKSKK
jgi:hypothetical protein